MGNLVCIPAEAADDLLDAMADAIKDAHNVGRYGECGGIGYREARAAFDALIATVQSNDAAQGGSGV